MYLDDEGEGALKMRISLADSQMDGHSEAPATTCGINERKPT